METSTFVLSVIVCLCSVFLTVPYGSIHLQNAATTVPPKKCFGNFYYEIKRNYNANGATIHSASKTPDACRNYCSDTAACKSIDYNVPNNECWIHRKDVEGSLQYVAGVNHYVKKDCPTTTPTVTPTVTPTGTTGPVPHCVKNWHYDDYVDTYVIGGTPKNHNTLIKCLEACSVTSSCTAVDFNSANECYFHTTDASKLHRQTSSNKGDVIHYVKESCDASSTTETTPKSTLPDINAHVSFRCYFANDYDQTISDKDAFIETFRQRWCSDTGVRCTRLLKPMLLSDVYKVTEKETPGPEIGYIVVEGLLAPGDDDETDTQTVMEDFKDDLFEDFRHRLSSENGQVRLQPVTSTEYEGFSWERVRTTDPPGKKEDDDDGPLGLKTEYWILIGLGALALIIAIVAVVVIVVLRRSSNTSESSDNAQKERERKRAEQERKRQEREEKRQAEEERRAREKEQKLNEKRDRDVEKGDENAYSEPEPDVVPTKTDDTPSGLSDDDKAY